MSATPLSYSLVVMHGDSLYAIRDPFGNRPLCLGRIANPNANPSTSGLEESESRPQSRDLPRHSLTTFEQSSAQSECLEKRTAAALLSPHVSALSASASARMRGSASFSTPGDVQQVARRLLQALKADDKAFVDSTCTPRCEPKQVACRIRGA